MKIIEKKFEVVNVGLMFWSQEYHEKLLADGYELIKEKMNFTKHIV